MRPERSLDDDWKDDDEVKGKEPHGDTSALLFRGFLLSVVLLFPVLFEFFFRSPDSYFLFSDWDEAFYLTQAYGLAQQFASSAKNGFFFDAFLGLLSPIPHNLILMILGSVQRLLDLRATSFGLFIDFFLVPVAYLLLTRAFRLFSPSALSAEFAAAVMLCLPWISYLPIHLQLPLSLPPEIVRISHNGFPALPILRGVVTQWSYLFVAVSLYLLGRALQEREQPSSLLFFSGIVAGFSIYIYFFCWPALVGLTLVFLVLYGIVHGIRGERLAVAVGSSLLYLWGALLPALPALFLLVRDIFFGGALQSPALPDAAPALRENFWYFSPEQALLALVAVVLLLLRPFRGSLGGLLLIAAIISEFVLMNSQGVLNKMVTPYHFPLFYLSPIGSAACALLFCHLVKTRTLQAISLGAVFFAMFCGRLVELNEVVKNSANINEGIQVIEAVKRYTEPTDILLSVMTDKPFAPDGEEYFHLTEPFYISSLTHRRHHADYVSAGGNVLDQEFLAGWVFSAHIQPVMPCPPPPKLPGDVLSGMLTRDRWIRHYGCQSKKKSLGNQSVCELLRAYPFDAVLWRNDLLSRSSWLPPEIMKSIWRSESGKYQLYRFNRDIAEATYCKDKS